MLDQSFSVDNFRKILDLENRKGVFLEGMFFESLSEATDDIKSQVALIKDLKKNRRSFLKEDYFSEKDRLNEKLKLLKDQKYVLLTHELDEVSKLVQRKDFKFKFTIGTAHSKTIYKVNSDAASYFALKQLQYNLRKIYKVKQGNRYQIICQLRELLSDKIPKYVIRTDIKGCYESIPSDLVLKKLNSDALLSLTSKSLLKSIFTRYKALSSSAQGVPRGIGVSAYLSEIYLRSLDREIRKLPNILFYARYVDDIVVIFTSTPNQEQSGLLELVKEKIESASLEINEEKTKYFDLTRSFSASPMFDYLGYRISFGSGEVKIDITKGKINKYKRRIKSAFDSYSAMIEKNELKARQLLIKRVKFLTGNTNLVNNKKHVRTGIYFSNSLISSTDTLLGIDCYLKSLIDLLENDRVKNNLSKFSFVKGFEEKVFYKFSVKDLMEIMEVWKHGS